MVALVADGVAKPVVGRAGVAALVGWRRAESDTHGVELGAIEDDQCGPDAEGSYRWFAAASREE